VVAVSLLGRALIGDGSCFGTVRDDRFHLITGDPFGDYTHNGQSFPMEDVVLGAPFEGVRFIAVMGGFNEPGTTRSPERQPMWLPKAANYASGDGAEVQKPSVLTGPMMMEAELAVVVGRQLRKASPAEAREAILGWTVFNDLTAFEYGATGFWALGKAVDGFASWGPWVRTDLSEDRVMEGLAITGRINGVEAQSGNTQYYCFTPSEMLSHVSHRISLFPGDVVTLGTPFPPPEVNIGDEVLCEVEEVGVLHNYIVADTREPPSLLPRKAKESTSAVG
jgi:2-keto-4-pentenoate hydratase/2-oxohepta-3-ene-1,7-dioic acid hydratase in catechol pathway